jgi:hypothetical protein
MRDTFAHYLLGTEAFISVCLDPASDPYNWLWGRGPRRLAHDGIVISSATTEYVASRIERLRNSNQPGASLVADRHQERVHTVISKFRDENCIIPISDRYWHFARYHIDIDLKYKPREGGEPVSIGVLEKVVIATAIIGVHQPMYLVDYDQPDAFRYLARTKQLEVGVFEHPDSHGESQKVVRI